MEIDVELPRLGEMSLEAVMRARDLQVRYEPSQTPDLPVPLGKRRRKSPRRACARQTAQPTHGPRARRRNPGPIYIPGAGGTTTVAPGVLHFGAFAKRVYPHGRTMPGTRRALRSQWIQDSTGAR